MRDSEYGLTLPPTSPTVPTATPHLTRLYAGLIIFIPPILLPKMCFQKNTAYCATIVFKRAVVDQNYDTISNLLGLKYQNCATTLKTSFVFFSSSAYLF